ncbi:ATP-binding protein [Streptomyces sp. NPDC055099]
MSFRFGQWRDGQLPAELTSFVGRAEEVALISHELANARLVTLVGPGGVGKSRTALRAAAGIQQRFEDGVWLAELSALSNPALVPATLAAVLDLPAQVGMKTMDALAAHLRKRRLLIVLDTCEHLVDACALLCDILLREAPGVSVLATSRQPLDVPGENILLMGPLRREEALELFTERAAAAVPGWSPAETDQEQVRALVDRLDRIPLALELAALRLRVAPLTELTARLGRRFEILTGGRRGAQSRHQTLRKAIDWSHELCTPSEQLLWQRLSVFAGPFELAAAKDVCADAAFDREAVLNGLLALVDKSVVYRTGKGQERYQLLDTVREYGAHGLGEGAGAPEVHSRHFAHYRQLAEGLWEELVTAGQSGWYCRARAEIADVRQALAFAFTEPGHARAGLSMAARLAGLWRAAGMPAEGRYWIDQGLDLVRDHCPERAWGLFAAGVLAMWAGDFEAARIRLGEASGTALQCGEDRIALFSDPCLGAMRALHGQTEAGLAAVKHGRDRIVAVGDRLGTSVVHVDGALLLALLGDTDTALAWCEEGLASLEDTGERQMYATALAARGIALWRAGRYEDCAAPLRRALDAVGEINDVYVAQLSCLGLAWDAARQERYSRAAWLLGHAESISSFRVSHIGVPPFLIDQQEKTRAAVLGALGPATFDRWYGLGGRMPTTDVLEAVRTDADVPTCLAHVPKEQDSLSTPEALTPREREVAALVTQGLSNRQIAERLVISKRTADTHVEHILAKLRVSSRAEVAPALESAS